MITSLLITVILQNSDPEYVIEAGRSVARLVYTPVQNGLERRLSVKFCVINKNRIASSKSMVIGPSIGAARYVSINDYLGNGRNQLFVSVEHGEIKSYLLDFDGRNIRKVYAMDRGRVVAFPTYDAGKYWIQELWPKGQYRDQFNDSPTPDAQGYIKRMAKI